jgi:hypothetical protein
MSFKPTAKSVLSNLRGDLAIAKANVITLNRQGVSSDAATKRVAILEYAVASVAANKLNGKSAFKEYERAKANASRR